MSATSKFLELIQTEDPYRIMPDNIRELQLEAVRERFATARSAIKVLDKRAEEMGIKEVNSLSDIVPLMFAHTNYKSYPESFVDKGQWKNMNLWLQTLSTRPVNIDVDGITDVDDWINRLCDAGHHVFATSGTSGKSSFMNRTKNDVDNYKHAHYNSLNWSTPHFKPNHDRKVFGFFPPFGVHPMSNNSRNYQEKVAAPGELHYLSTEPLLAMQTIKAGHMRRKIAAGTALPEEIAAFERETLATQERMQKGLNACIDGLLDARHEPTFIGAQWPMLWRIVEAARARGIPAGDFNPDTIVTNGGGIKGVKLPDDYQQQIYSYLGIPKENFQILYGMSEMTAVCPYAHKLSGYVIPPWIVPLILDKSGERLIDPDGTETRVEGRMAFFDIAVEGRWGGLISGDKVVVEFGETPDGVKAPRVMQVARYADLEEGEDKLTCAGSIETYVRGNIGT